MGVRDLINKFTAGELDAKFIAEVDYDGYRKAARKLRNVLCVPQGGVQRRFGTEYQQTIMNGVQFITDPDQVRLIEYEHQNDNLFDIIIRADSTSLVAFDIYLFGVFQISVPAPANTWDATMIRDIRWVKDYDRLIILHQQVRPYQLMWIANNNWTLTPITFQFFPTFDFTYSDNPATLPTPNTPYWSAGVTFTPNAVAATQITASIAVFTSNHVGGLYFGNGGIFRITAVNPAGTIATGFVVEDFIDTSPIPGNLSSLHERAWNDGAAIAGAPVGIARFWPGHGCFYQSRLVLGGSPALPGTVFASVVKAYYDFDDSTSDASSTWGVEIGVTGNDIIQDILPTKSLVLLSNKGPASTSILLDSPITPTNAFLNTQGTEGSRNMNAVIIDNQIIYADRAGNTIWSMSYEIPDTGYNITNASILSAQLIRGPRWADIFDPDDIDGRYYLLVNSDGSLAIYTTILTENIKSWTLATTVGSFVDVGCTANQAKLLVRRQVNTDNIFAGLMQAIYLVDGTFNAFRNVTINTNTGMQTILANPLDYILIGNEIPFTGLFFTLGAGASQDLDLQFQFLTNTGVWETFTPVDTTSGLLGSGPITWTIDQVTNWAAQTLDGTTPAFDDLATFYWIRIQRINVDPTVSPPQTMGINTNTQNRIYLEKATFTDTLSEEVQGIYMDCQINTTSDATGLITGLTPLVGQNVFVFANGFPLQTYNVNQAGQIQLDAFNANAEIWVGLDYQTLIIPMPVIGVLANGISVYEPTHVDYLYIDFYNSLGITVQGQPIPQLSPGAFMTEEVPIPVSSYYKAPQFGGWDAREEFTITQSYPAPMTILAVSYTLEVSP